MTWVVSATLLVTVTVTVTFSLAFREPPDIRTTRPRGYGKIRSLTWAGGWNGIQTCTLVPTPAADLSIA